MTDYIGTLSFADYDEVGDDSPTTLPTTPKLVAEREVDSRIARLNQTWGHANATVRSLSHKYQKLWDGAITKRSRPSMWCKIGCGQWAAFSGGLGCNL